MLKNSHFTHLRGKERLQCIRMKRHTLSRIFMLFILVTVLGLNRSGDDQEVLFDQILMGQVDFPSPYWDNVSDSAKVGFQYLPLIDCISELELLIVNHCMQRSRDKYDLSA